MLIHILLFIAFCGLFFVAKGFFSKSGAYLAGKIPAYLQITKSQIRLFLMAVFWGNMIGFFITAFVSMHGTIKELKRQQDAYTEELLVTDGSIEEKIEVEVGIEPYTDQEKKVLLEDAMNHLTDEILGQNQSLDYVEYPLNFVTELNHSQIMVKWKTDQPLILSWDGNIGESVPKEGTKVQIQAELVLDDYRRVYEEVAVVYPKKKSEREQLISAIEEELQKQSEKQGEYLVLPEMAGDSKLTWTKNNQYYGVFLVGMAIVIGVLLAASEKSQKKQENEKRLKQMEEDYPIILNKLILLMRSGMSSRRAIKKIAIDYRRDKKMGKPKRYAYEEFQTMYLQLEKGSSEEEVYQNLGNRCELLCYRTLSTLLIQNLKKGSSYFLNTLKAECTAAFEARKNRALVRGEEAGTKLLIPMVCMLLIVLLIILVPSMVTLG